jgi:Ca2+-binding EF-hand superfamily protein
MKMNKALKVLLKDENKLNTFVRAAFSAIDQDGSGQIDDSELFEVLKVVSGGRQGNVRIEDVKAAMNELDTYNDGFITFEEFKAMVVAALNILYQREYKESDKNNEL